MKKCYTAKSLVLDCLWCTFHVPSGHPGREHDKFITGGYNHMTVYSVQYITVYDVRNTP